MRVEMLPALHGDCLFVEYGRGHTTQRALVDGGPMGSYEALARRLEAIPLGDRTFEMMVLTHVDTDHVDGLVKLFASGITRDLRIRDIWFNGWRHIRQYQTVLGGKQGEYLSVLLDRKLQPNSWNEAFGGKAIVVPRSGDLPVKQVGHMTVTLLSPTPSKLELMASAWTKDVGAAMTPGDSDAAWALLLKQTRYSSGRTLLGSTADFDSLLQAQSRPDSAAANGSSIAFLAEVGVGYERKSCLFLADAHPDAVCDSLRRLLRQRRIEKLSVDAVKVAHHGSKGNTTDELLSLIDSPRYLISTNGAQFDHPDHETILRIIARSSRPVKLYFNYRSDTTAPWDDDVKRRELSYTTFFREDCQETLSIEL